MQVKLAGADGRLRVVTANSQQEREQLEAQLAALRDAGEKQRAQLASEVEELKQALTSRQQSFLQLEGEHRKIEEELVEALEEVERLRKSFASSDSELRRKLSAAEDREAQLTSQLVSSSDKASELEEQQRVLVQRLQEAQLEANELKHVGAEARALAESRWTALEKAQRDLLKEEEERRDAYRRLEVEEATAQRKLRDMQEAAEEKERSMSELGLRLGLLEREREKLADRNRELCSERDRWCVELRCCCSLLQGQVWDVEQELQQVVEELGRAQRSSSSLLQGARYEHTQLRKAASSLEREREELRESLLKAHISLQARGDAEVAIRTRAARTEEALRSRASDADRRTRELQSSCRHLQGRMKISEAAVRDLLEDMENIRRASMEVHSSIGHAVQAQARRTEELLKENGQLRKELETSRQILQEHALARCKLELEVDTLSNARRQLEEYKEESWRRMVEMREGSRRCYSEIANAVDTMKTVSCDLNREFVDLRACLADRESKLKLLDYQLRDCRAELKSSLERERREEHEKNSFINELEHERANALTVLEHAQDEKLQLQLQVKQAERELAAARIRMRELSTMRPTSDVDLQA
eukprot:308022-Hanusia_phi.AAC.1